MANKAFLSAAERKQLAEFIAAKGESYARYLDWCDENHVPEAKRFTQGYLHRWAGRRRDYIHSLRAQHQEETRRRITLDKASRVKMLEASVGRLQFAIDDCEDPALLVKLEEQLGKALDRISRELGEYGKQVADEDASKAVNRQLAALALKALERAAVGGHAALPEPVIEGEFEEAE